MDYPQLGAALFGLGLLVAFAWWGRPRAVPIDPRTGRPNGDHGTAVQAIEYALDEADEPDTFLRAWREGDLDEWPEFYSWLRGEWGSVRVLTPAQRGDTIVGIAVGGPIAAGTPVTRRPCMEGLEPEPGSGGGGEPASYDGPPAGTYRQAPPIAELDAQLAARSLEETIHRARYLHSEPGPMDRSDAEYAGRIANAVRRWYAAQPEPGQ